MILRRKIPKFQNDGKTAFANQCWGEMCDMYKNDERMAALKKDYKNLYEAAVPLNNKFDHYSRNGFTHRLSQVLGGTGYNADKLSSKLAFDYLGLVQDNGRPAVNNESKITTWTRKPSFFKEYGSGIKPFLFKDLNQNATPEERAKYYEELLDNYGGLRSGTNERGSGTFGRPGDLNFLYGK